MSVRITRAVITLQEYNIVKSMSLMEDVSTTSNLWESFPRNENHRRIWGAMLSLQTRVKDALLLLNPQLGSVHYYGSGAHFAEIMFRRMGNRKEFFAAALSPYLIKTFMPITPRGRARYIITGRKLRDALSLMLMCCTPHE